MPRNDGEGSSAYPPLSIFNHPGRGYGKCITATLDERDMKAAHLHILLNCDEVKPYIK